MISNTIYCTLPHSLGSFCYCHKLYDGVTCRSPRSKRVQWIVSIGSAGTSCRSWNMWPETVTPVAFSVKVIYLYRRFACQSIYKDPQNVISVICFFSQDFSKIPQLRIQIIIHYFVGIMYKLTTVKSSQPCQSNRSNQPRNVRNW